MIFKNTPARNVLLGIALLSICAIADDDSGKFLKDAAQGGMAEVKEAKLALKKSSDKDVKAFARHMIADHGKANGKVMKLAKRKHVKLPKSPGMTQKNAYQRLAVMSGPGFDRAYLDRAVEDHKAAVSAFQAQAQGGTDADVKAFASTTLPTLQMHLDMARDLDTTLAKQPEKDRRDNQHLEKKSE